MGNDKKEWLKEFSITKFKIADHVFPVAENILNNPFILHTTIGEELNKIRKPRIIAMEE